MLMPDAKNGLKSDLNVYVLAGKQTTLDPRPINKGPSLHCSRPSPISLPFDGLSLQQKTPSLSSPSYPSPIVSSKTCACDDVLSYTSLLELLISRGTTYAKKNNSNDSATGVDTGSSPLANSNGLHGG